MCHPLLAYVLVERTKCKRQIFQFFQLHPKFLEKTKQVSEVGAWVLPGTECVPGGNNLKEELTCPRGFTGFIHNSREGVAQVMLPR